MSRSITYEEAKKRLEDRRELAEAYLRARIEARSKNSNNNNGDNNNNNSTDLDRLERIAILLNKASLTFNQAVNANGSKRRELLEEAFKAYVDIVPYLGKIPYLTIPVLQQIKNIERLIEMEIENIISKENRDTNTDTGIDGLMKESFL